jgi:hypothetical protein
LRAYRELCSRLYGRLLRTPWSCEAGRVLPYVHLVPPADTETEVQCGPVEVELRASANQVMHASGRVLETNLPFHVHCRVLVVDAHLNDVPERTEVWLKE